MQEPEYHELIIIENEGQICETNEGERVLVLERDESVHFDMHDEGYPISRETLETCAGWDVEAVHIHEQTTDELYEVDIESYYDARVKPVFDDEFLTAPLPTTQ